MGRPNLLWIMTDQQQSRAIGCLDASYKTPNLDALAACSIRFDKHITTCAQCTPSRATWMTGRFPHQVGVNQLGHALSADQPTVAKELLKAGYETAYFGKWHLHTPLDEHGFTVTDGPVGDDLDYGGGNAEDERAYSHIDAVTTAKAMNYLRRIDGNKPFFAVVSWNSPHPGDGPFELIGRFANEYPLESMPVPASFTSDDLSKKPAHQLARATIGESALDERTVRVDAQKYRTMIQLMDWHLGRILELLEQRGLRENTVILFTSDHGDLQGAHRLRLKGVVPYKELYEVPLLLHIPGRSDNSGVVHRLTSSAAVPGTLLDIAGVKIPSSFEGGSLLPLIDSAESMSVQENDFVFFEHYRAYWGFHPFRGIQTPAWKYIYYYHDNWEEMYHLAEDPDEVRNQADDPRWAQIKAQLRRLVDDWWEETGALSVEPIKVQLKGYFEHLV
ncbi:sulfatase family protein [Paenibacillus cymbidii]|uniref:sulfatase family protein n=1 Tax=Paenibacillus cymbidii TaxID=1639034 RepID=UPI001436A378|nr:sulfatase-like hydrolase/transferase [Paenibacillus cymbidii]